MRLLGRVRYAEVWWAPLLLALVLTGFGLAFVISATSDPLTGGWGREARLQVLWLMAGLAACLAALHVPLATWRATAPAWYGTMLIVHLAMIVLAGSALVPVIKGASNWIAIGAMRLQPSEFTKLAVLLLCARILAAPRGEREPVPLMPVLAAAAVPSALIAKEDLGSALTIPPMVAGLLYLAGARLRHLAVLAALGVAAIGGLVALLPRDSYQWKRLLAWWDPEAFALTEGYQTIRALRAVGSGQWTGKGWGLGDQNLLGWLPEKHTDMIFAVVGEETGLVGSLLALGCFLAFGWGMLHTASACRDPYGRLVVGGFACLVMGQMAINLAVVLGLMPVTGITLPFFSYGGSSLLGLYLGIGICLAATAARGRDGGYGRMPG